MVTISRAIIAFRYKVSRTGLEIIMIINSFSRHDIVHAVWVPSHQGVIGNEESNTLANTAIIHTGVGNNYDNRAHSEDF